MYFNSFKVMAQDGITNVSGLSRIENLHFRQSSSLDAAGEGAGIYAIDLQPVISNRPLSSSSRKGFGKRLFNQGGVGCQTSVHIGLFI